MLLHDASSHRAALSPAQHQQLLRYDASVAANKGALEGLLVGWGWGWGWTSLGRGTKDYPL